MSVDASIQRQAKESAGAQSEPLRLLMTAYSFPPLSRSGTIRVEAFSHYLPEYGIHTTVLTDELSSAAAKTRHADTTQINGWDDSAQPYQLRRVSWQLQSPPSAGLRFLRRLPGGASLAQRTIRARWLKRMLPLADQVVNDSQIDIIFGSAAPTEAVLLAAALGQRHKKPYVLDLRDPWSYQPPLPYRHYLDFLAERRIESKTLCAADAVVVTTQTTADLLVENLSVSPEKITVIPNGYDERDFETNEEPVPPTDKFVVTHAGQLTLIDAEKPPVSARIKSLLGIPFSPMETDTTARSPKYLLEAAARFLQQHPDAQQTLRIQLVGINDAGRCSAIRSFPFPDCLKVVERVSPAEAVSLCRRSHLLVLMQNRYHLDGREFCVAIPAKVYTYLRTGRRILACVPKSEISALVDRANAGICVLPDDTEAMAAALSQEYDSWRNGQRMTQWPQVGRFDRRHLTGQLADLLKSVAR